MKAELENNLTSKNHTIWILLALVILAAGLRIYHLSYKSISIDEAIGSFYAVEDLERVVILTINDVHPPLFYVVHHFWIKIFGTSEMALRSIAIFFALLSILLLYRLGSIIFNRKIGLIAAFLLSISPWHVWISQNARSNSMLLFLVLLSTYCFYKTIQNGHKKWLVFYTIVTSISLYTHYFSFMVWFAQNLYALSSPYIREHKSKNWWQAQIIIVLLYFLWLPFMISQFITKSRPMYKVFSVHFLENLFDHLNAYAPISKSPLFIAGQILFLFLFLFGIYKIFRTRATIQPSLTNNEEPLLMKNKTLATLFILATVLFVIIGIYFNYARVMPMLESHIDQNCKVIYASKIKPYHIEQIRSLPYSFFGAAIISYILFILTIFFSKFVQALSYIGKFLEKTFKTKNNFSILAFLLVHLILPIIIAALLSIKSPYLLLRNMIIAFPAYLLIISCAIYYLPRLWTKSLVFIAIIFLTVFSFLNFENWEMKNDWRHAALTAKEHIKDGDIILLDHLFGKKPFFYYGLETVKPLKRFKSEKEIKEFQGDIWFLMSYPNKWSAYQLLEENFEKEQVWSFTGSTNQDDMSTIDGKIHLIHFKKKNKSITEKQNLAINNKEG